LLWVTIEGRGEDANIKITGADETPVMNNVLKNIT